MEIEIEIVEFSIHKRRTHHTHGGQEGQQGQQGQEELG